MICAILLVGFPSILLLYTFVASIIGAQVSTDGVKKR